MADPIRIGMVGAGRAAHMMRPAIAGSVDFRLAGVADPDAPAREALIGETQDVIRADSLPELLDRAELDAVYIATPTPLHLPQVREAAQAGKHIIVEKPMASTVDEARGIVEAAEEAGVALVVGHTQSFEPPIRLMAELARSGRYGPVRMINQWFFSDWFYRPRRPDELDPAVGGGVTVRQGAHQFDIIRLIMGAPVRSVRAQTGSWDPARPGIGAHCTFLSFPDGAVATAIYSGYDHFAGPELTFGIDEHGIRQDPWPVGQRIAAIRGTDATGELSAKRARTRQPVGAAEHPSFFGLTLVSCAEADLRQSPTGVYVYSASGREDIPLPPGANGHANVLAELRDAITGAAPTIHDARWGLATMEICEAAERSSREQREITLLYQGA